MKLATTRYLSLGLFIMGSALLSRRDLWAREPLVLSAEAPFGIKWKDGGASEYAGYRIAVRFDWAGMEATQLWTRVLPIPGSSNHADEFNLTWSASVPLNAARTLRAELGAGPAWFRSQGDEYDFSKPGWVAAADLKKELKSGFSLGVLARYSQGTYYDCCSTDYFFDSFGNQYSRPKENPTFGLLTGFSLGYSLKL